MEQKTSFHLFIIPDGNRRWAFQRSLSNISTGHQDGYLAFKKVFPAAFDLGVTHFTFWAFSNDNLLKRSEHERGVLLNILTMALAELDNTHQFWKKEVRFRAIGRWEKDLPNHAKMIHGLEDATAHHTGPELTLLLAYDGQWDIEETYRCFIKDSGSTLPVTFELLKSKSPAGFLPFVDAMIRTGGDPHLSGGALPFHMQNPALYFPEKFWPDFTPEELSKIIADFKNRERRLGA